MEPQHQVQPYVPLPGFTVQQSVYVRAYIWSSVNLSVDWKPSLNAAFNEYFGLPLPPLQWPEQATQATQQSTPPAPQEAKKEQEPLQQASTPLYQATVEDVTETTAESTEHGSISMTVTNSKLSTKSGLCTAPASRDPAACLSKALSAHQQASFLASLFGSFFGSFLTSFSASQLGYIRYSEGMEATGEG